MHRSTLEFNSDDLLVNIQSHEYSYITCIYFVNAFCTIEGQKTQMESNFSKRREKLS